jgi:predicted ATP-dependent endonuclease of OLD family
MRPATAQPGIVAAVDACCEAGVRGVVLLVEEPELYLGPQGQRYLYRMLRRFVEAGNQVVYSTHAPTFLNAARLDEVVFVERLEAMGTRVARAAPLTAEKDFRVLSEFDAERSELLLARAALLVEGLTEKLAFPFVFAALGYDADQEGITIVECGGKANIPLFARVCAAAGVPCVAVHDRDARPGRRPRLSERVNNALVREAVGTERTIVVEPDFEGLVHLPGGSRKPEQAWHRFASLRGPQMPEPLTRAAHLAVELARSATARTGGRA